MSWSKKRVAPDEDPVSDLGPGSLRHAAEPPLSRSPLRGILAAMSEPRTIVFFPEGAFGPTNNCVGIGAVLRERGHRVVFVVEESFAGTLEAKGFEERLMRLGPPPEVPEVPGQFWKDFIRDTAPVFRTPTIEQLSGFIQPTWQALVDGAKYVHPRLLEIFDELGPDVIVEDNVVAFPALPASGRPWVRIASCNPAELLDPDVPPVFSGYPADDRSGWAAFRAEYRRTSTARCGRTSTRSAATTARRACPTDRMARRSSTSRRSSTCTSTRPRRTTRGRARSPRPGTGSTRASGRPRPTWELPETLARPRRARSSTSASAASARPTSS